MNDIKNFDIQKKKTIENAGIDIQKTEELSKLFCDNFDQCHHKIIEETKIIIPYFLKLAQPLDAENKNQIIQQHDQFNQLVINYENKTDINQKKQLFKMIVLSYIGCAQMFTKLGWYTMPTIL